MTVFRTLMLTAFAVSSEKNVFEINNVSEPPPEEELSAMTGKHMDEKVKQKEEPKAREQSADEGVKKSSGEEGSGEAQGEEKEKKGTEVHMNEDEDEEKKDTTGGEENASPLVHPGEAQTYTAEELFEKFGMRKKRTHNEYGEVLLFNEDGEELIDPGTPENQVNVILGILLHACNDDRVPPKECDNLHKMLDLPLRERDPNAWPKIVFDADGYQKHYWPNDNVKMYNDPDADLSHEAQKQRWEQEELAKLEEKEAEELAKLEQAAEKLRSHKEERKRERERQEREEQEELAKLEQAAEKLRHHGEEEVKKGEEKKEDKMDELEAIRRQYEAAKAKEEAKKGVNVGHRQNSV